MRLSFGRAAPRRCVEILCAFLPDAAPGLRSRSGLALLALLLALPPLAPEAAAGRAASPRAEQGRQRHAVAAARLAVAPARLAVAPAQATVAPARATVAPARHAVAPARAGREARAAPRQATRVPPPAALGAAAPAVEVAGARPVVVTALGHAVRSTGIDPLLLTALAWQESRFDPRARNSRSTARGLMQFTEGTWLQAVRDHGPQHGLRYESAVLSTDPATGVITTRLPRTRDRILDLRDNPRYAAALAAERINRARMGLEAVLGRPAKPADLYMIHLLGPGGAQRFLTALDRTPGRPATEVVSADSVAANPGVFTDRASGRALTLAQVHAWVDGAIDGQKERHAPLLAALGVPVVVQVAEAP